MGLYMSLSRTWDSRTRTRTRTWCPRTRTRTRTWASRTWFTERPSAHSKYSWTRVLGDFTADNGCALYVV